ncbi:MAG: metal ABC transporter ATP-binding protein, partial [Proteobacteria bacterium]|nr:metal ABC transporter ATP-binding protein [Pseudomonadota bacterium]
MQVTSNVNKVVVSLVLCSFLLGPIGCATPPDKISATYVSPLQYSSYNCNQIGEEFLRVNRKVAEVSGVQQKEANKDKLAMGVGLVVFWPALFFMMGDDKKEELARLKGEFEALEHTAIKKECSLVAELEEARKVREELSKKDK